MSLWLIHPRDPLVVRDGRPNDRRSESNSLPFPHPGSVAGVVRTRLGSHSERGFELFDSLPDLLRVAIRGPLMAGQRPGAPTSIFAPAPRDALFASSGSGHDDWELKRLHPIEAGGAIHDTSLGDLLLIGQDSADVVAGKPPATLPHWWPWRFFEKWLCIRSAADITPADLRDLERDGIEPLPRESRIHVAIDSNAGTTREGALFGTAGLRFSKGTAGPDWALFFDVAHEGIDALAQRAITPGMSPFGGERRIVRWEGAADELWPSPPGGVVDHIAARLSSVYVRVILLTPGIFAAGTLPSGGRSPMLPTPTPDLSVILRAASVPRPEVVSGWDMAAGKGRGRPKPTRRLVAAGSVYWLELAGTPAARRAWLDRVWMQNVSDDAQDRNDGYGLAAVGV